MTVTQHGRATVRELTVEEANAELQGLIRRSGMTRDELSRRATSYQLNAKQRSLLADIEGLEWMLK